jgi:hypothetical protein
MRAALLELLLRLLEAAPQGALAGEPIDVLDGNTKISTKNAIHFFKTHQFFILAYGGVACQLALRDDVDSTTRATALGAVVALAVVIRNSFAPTSYAHNTINNSLVMVHNNMQHCHLFYLLFNNVSKVCSCYSRAVTKISNGKHFTFSGAQAKASSFVNTLAKLYNDHCYPLAFYWSCIGSW